MTAKQVPCPVCRAMVAWTDRNRWRPFCSERCKIIDLGDWASDRHVVAGSSTCGEVPPVEKPD